MELYLAHLHFYGSPSGTDNAVDYVARKVIWVCKTCIGENGVKGKRPESFRLVQQYYEPDQGNFLRCNMCTSNKLLRRCEAACEKWVNQVKA